MSLLSQAKLPDLASLMAQSYGGGSSAADANLQAELSMLLRPQYDQHAAAAAMSKNSDLASLNASIDMLGNLFSSGKNNADINSLLFPQTTSSKGGPSQADIASFLAAAGHGPMNPPSTQSFSSKSSTVSNPYYSQSAAALDKAQQDLLALYSGNPIGSSSGMGGSSSGGGSSSSGKYPSIPDPLSKSTLAANNMFMNPSIYAKLQQDALNAMMKPPSKTSSKSESKSREQSESSRLIPSRTSTPSPSSTKHHHHNFNVADLAVSSVNQTRPSSRSPHKKQFSISDLVSPPPSKMMKMMESFGHDLHGDDKAEILNLSGSSSDK